MVGAEPGTHEPRKRLRGPGLWRSKVDMQISKLLAIGCVASLCLTSLSMQAADGQAQPTPAPAASEKATPTKAEAKKQAKAQKEAEKAKKAQAKQKCSQCEMGKTAVAPKSAPKAPVAQALEVPPLPISADKETRLKELTSKYKAGDIAPEQYHKERAKILAEP